MILKKKISLIVGLAILLAIMAVFFSPIKINYSITSKVQIKPHLEWELSKTIDGTLITSLKDNLKNSINSYSVTEFQRGDVVEFKLNETLFEKDFIEKGDTIGIIYSNEEQRKLIELIGNLKILEAEYTFYTTGQKPEDVDRALKELMLAEKELETQQKLMARSEILVKDTVISLQQYDIDLNELKVKEMTYEIAKANYESVKTGEKPEQADLINSKIKALNLQIEQLKERINYFTLLSPIDGILEKNSFQAPLLENVRNDIVLKIVNIDHKIGVAPIKISDLPYFSIGSKAYLPKEEKYATLIDIDNVAQNNWTTSSVFLNFKIEEGLELNGGTFTEIKIYGLELTIKDYLIKLFTLK